MSSSIKMSTSTSSTSCGETNDPDELRRGPWTMEEDALLIHYISRHGEGRWNLLAKRSGLKRNGKSCRLRWLNYLKPDVKRGNLTPQEQMSILELHSKWGNRWSKIAQHLPGRTDNEIKNYWRTRVQKQARHLKIDANSKAFQDVIRCFWIPRLLQKIDGSSSISSSSQNSTMPDQPFDQTFQHYSSSPLAKLSLTPPKVAALQEPNISSQSQAHRFDHQELNSDSEHGTNNSCISSSESINFSQISQLSDYQTSPFHVTSSCCSGFYDINNSTNTCCDMEPINLQATMEPAHGDFNNQVHNNFQMEDNNWVEYDLAAADDGIWNMDYELWQLKNALANKLDLSCSWKFTQMGSDSLVSNHD